MLKRLIINNVALISSLELEFFGGLNILSGETGAGKSIIVDSLMLLLGGKYDKTLLKFGASEGFVEGYFSEVNALLFEQIGLDIDDDVVIKRRFNENGKNDIRINGQSVTLSMLKRFAAGLVDIYGQNEYQSLALPAKHLCILDYYTKEIDDLLAELERHTKSYAEISKKLASIGDEEQRKRNLDILKYQIDEIVAVKMGEHEEEEIMERRRLLLSSERIKTALMLLSDLISGEQETSVNSLLNSVAKSLGGIASLSTAYQELFTRVEGVIFELSDIADSAADQLDSIGFDEADLDKLERRLEAIRACKRKYGNYESMQKFLRTARDDYEFLLSADQAYETLLLDSEAVKRKIYSLSKTISAKRKECAQSLQQRVITELAELGMQDARFEIVFQDFPTWDEMDEHISPSGMDKVEFYLSANAGQPLLPLAKVISGGEMSRFMLALKVISSDTDTIQAMIFDEVDTGISGRIGQVVAKKLARISRRRQVLCVTHLPQIAAMADEHYFISKSSSGGNTQTNVQKLEEQEMIAEISRLSGGQDISSRSLENAREIKSYSKAFKNSLE